MVLQRLEGCSDREAVGADVTKRGEDHSRQRPETGQQPLCLRRIHACRADLVQGVAHTKSQRYPEAASKHEPFLEGSQRLSHVATVKVSGIGRDASIVSRPHVLTQSSQTRKTFMTSSP